MSSIGWPFAKAKASLVNVPVETTMAPSARDDYSEDLSHRHDGDRRGAVLLALDEIALAGARELEVHAPVGATHPRRGDRVDLATKGLTDYLLELLPGEGPKVIEGFLGGEALSSEEGVDRREHRSRRDDIRQQF